MFSTCPFVRPFVRPFLHASVRPSVCYQTCEHGILITTEPILTPNCALGKGIKSQLCGLRRTKIQVTRGQRLIGGLAEALFIMDPIGSSRFYSFLVGVVVWPMFGRYMLTKLVITVAGLRCYSEMGCMQWTNVCYAKSFLLHHLILLLSTRLATT